MEFETVSILTINDLPLQGCVLQTPFSLPEHIGFHSGSIAFPRLIFGRFVLNIVLVRTLSPPPHFFEQLLHSLH